MTTQSINPQALTPAELKAQTTQALQNLSVPAKPVKQAWWVVFLLLTNVKIQALTNG